MRRLPQRSFTARLRLACHCALLRRRPAERAAAALPARSGFIYFQAAPFDELPGSYECPQCAAPKGRFAGYDPETGKTKGGGASGLPQLVNIAGAVGLVGTIALVVLGLQ